jgi:hypothetical protein
MAEPAEVLKWVEARLDAGLPAEHPPHFTP